MHWLYLLLACGVLLLAINAADAWVLALSLLVVLALFLAWAHALYRQRLGGEDRGALDMIDPVELRRMRELAEARRKAEAGAGSAAPGDAAPPPAP